MEWRESCRSKTTEASPSAQLRVLAPHFSHPRAARPRFREQLWIKCLLRSEWNLCCSVNGRMSNFPSSIQIIKISQLFSTLCLQTCRAQSWETMPRSQSSLSRYWSLLIQESWDIILSNIMDAGYLLWITWCNSRSLGVRSLPRLWLIASVERDWSRCNLLLDLKVKASPLCDVARISLCIIKNLTGERSPSGACSAGGPELQAAGAHLASGQGQVGSYVPCIIMIELFCCDELHIHRPV